MSPPSRLWIIPPHRDATLSPGEVPGWRVADLQQRFFQRLLSPDALAAQVQRRREGLGAGGSPQALVELEAARAILGRAGLPVASRLRAGGLALSVLTAQAPVRLRLDDVELAGGSTERTSDLLAIAARDDLPWEPELAEAVEEARGAAEVRILVDCDQRLPFTFALVLRLRRWAPSLPVTLCGGYALLHREALGSALEGVEFSPALPGLRLAEQGLDWVWEGQPPPDRRWAGYVPPAALETLDPLCALAVVPFAALEPTRALSLDGEWFPLSRVEAAARLRPVVGEWHFGAPGVDGETAERTAQQLSQPSGFGWIAGARRFHWSRGRSPLASFNGQPLQIGGPAQGKDLARSLAVQAPHTLEEEALHLLVRRTLERLNAAPRPPSPGRVAGGLGQPPAAVPPASQLLAQTLCLAPDAAVVELPVTLEGRAQRTVVLTTLLGGGMLSLDPRLLAGLQRALLPVPAHEFLAHVPAAAREKLVRALIDRRMLEGVAT